MIWSNVGSERMMNGVMPLVIGAVMYYCETFGGSALAWKALCVMFLIAIGWIAREMKLRDVDEVGQNAEAPLVDAVNRLGDAVEEATRKIVDLITAMTPSASAAE